MNFLDWILFQAKANPRKMAMALPDRAVTYAMLATGVACVADQARRQGLRPGDLVALSVDDPIRHMVLASGLFGAGVTAAASVFDAIEMEERNVKAVLSAQFNRHSLIRQIVVDDEWFSSSANPAPPISPFGENDIFRIAFSSGVTGRPKGVGLTAAIIERRNAQRMAMSASIGCDRWLILPSVVGNWGFRAALQVLCAGGMACFARTPVEALHMADLFGAHYIVASTHQLHELLEIHGADPIGANTVRAIEVSGSVMSLARLQEAARRFGARILVNYGSTESGVVAYGWLDAMRDVPGAAGFLAPWAQVEIRNQDGEPCPCGVEGEVYLRTASRARYVADASEDASGGGWFRPGDRGWLEEDGLLVISGRANEIINAGGLKIAPEKIEQMLAMRPEITDAAAVAVRGSSGMDEIWLAIVSPQALDESELIAWCGRQGILIKRAARIAAIPRSATGKIMREDVRRSLTR